MGNLANVWVCTSEERLLGADVIARVGPETRPSHVGASAAVCTFFGNDQVDQVLAMCSGEHVAAVPAGLVHALARIEHEKDSHPRARFLHLTETGDEAPTWELSDTPPSHWNRADVLRSRPEPPPLPGSGNPWDPWDRTDGAPPAQQAAPADTGPSGERAVMTVITRTRPVRRRSGDCHVETGESARLRVHVSRDGARTVCGFAIPDHATTVATTADWHLHTDCYNCTYRLWPDHAPPGYLRPADSSGLPIRRAPG